MALFKMLHYTDGEMRDYGIVKALTKDKAIEMVATANNIKANELMALTKAESFTMVRKSVSQEFATTALQQRRVKKLLKR